MAVSPRFPPWPAALQIALAPGPLSRSRNAVAASICRRVSWFFVSPELEKHYKSATYRFGGNHRTGEPFPSHKGRQPPFEEKIMNKIATGLLATTLSISFAAAAAMPANAAQMFVPQTSSASSDVQTVDYKPWIKRHGNRNFGNRDFRVGRQFARNNDGGGYWNGHRGSREYHRGYRRHGDYWFPLAAFATGALITGAIVNSENNRVDRGDSHVEWCYDRYRSYRASDNTFQPNYGPRQQCNSPY
jgi:hypothetical protein